MKTLRRLASTLPISALITAASPPLSADMVTEWNRIGETAAAAAGAPPLRSRVMAMAHLAVHDALNAIEPRHERYAGGAIAASGASPGAAVAAAAYRVLAATVPSQSATLGAQYEASILGLPDCLPAFPGCIEDGIAAGEAAAAAIIALRVDDGSATPHLPYTLLPGLGVYERTPPANAAPQFAGWANLTPFAMRFGAQFRAEPPGMFDIQSEAYTRDYNEVKRVGSPSSEANGDRTPDQSAIARFWPASSWNGIARTIVAGRGLDEWQNARLFALVNVANADAFIAAFDTKYTYNFWRPVTAIRMGDADGNPATAGDPSWVSYQPTPPYPDYTCGLTSQAGSATEAMRLFFGTDDIAFTFTAGGLTRSWASFSQAGNEAVDARVFGGMHFRTGCEMGLRQGEQVARFAFRHYLRPLRRGFSPWVAAAF